MERVEKRKLKRRVRTGNSVEAYACNCACHCVCMCSCDTAIGKFTDNLSADEKGANRTAALTGVSQSAN